MGLASPDGKLLWSADACDDIFTLRIDQKFTVELILPVEGSRVKATPVAQSLPIFPKTMAWTFTAVPHHSGMSCNALAKAIAKHAFKFV